MIMANVASHAPHALREVRIRAGGTSFDAGVRLLVGGNRAMSRVANGMSIISWSTSWKPVCWLGEVHQRKQPNMCKDSEFRL
jgi:hypothetical protein